MDAKNFALRIDMKNTAFLHCDWERDAAIFRMRLDELMVISFALIFMQCVLLLLFESYKIDLKKIEGNIEVCA